MKIRTIISLTTGLCITLFAFNLSLPMGLTTNRIAFFFIFTLLGLLIALRINPFDLSHRSFYFFALTAYLLLIIVALSVFFAPFPQFVGALSLIRWLLIMLIALIIWQLSYSMNSESEETLFHVLVLGATALTLFTFYEVFKHAGISNINNFSVIRQTFMNNMGLNNYLARLLTVNVFPIAIALGIVKTRGHIRILSVFTSVIFVYIVFSSGSRQNILAIIVFTLVLYIMYKSFSYKPSYKEIIGIICILFIPFILLNYDIFQMYSWFERRFIDQTLTQIQEGPGRLYLYKVAFDIIIQYPILGVGPGVYRAITIAQPHNGFLLLGAELGIAAFALIVFAIFYLLIRSFKWRTNALKNGLKNLFIVSFSFAVTWLFITNTFNDMLEEYNFWIIIALMVTSTEARSVIGKEKP